MVPTASAINSLWLGGGDFGSRAATHGVVAHDTGTHTLNNFVTRSAHEVSGTKNRSDLSAIQIQRRSDTTCGSINLCQMRVLQLDRHFTSRTAARPPYS